MPELPEVETVRLTLLPHLKGQIIECATRSQYKLRKMPAAADLQKMSGQTVRDITRRAKYLCLHLSPSNDVLVVHLGMTGSFRIDKKVAVQKHDHFMLELKNKKHVVYNDPRRFGMIFLVRAGKLESHQLFQRLGPEPFSSEFSPQSFAQSLAHKKQAIKQTLLDQHIVVGVGNIYASEALYRAGISPVRAAGSLLPGEVQKLYQAICAVLKAAIKAGGSTIRDFKAVDGQSGYFAHEFNVYGHEGEPCAGCTCKKKIQKIVQAGRSTFYCPQKQR